MKDLLKKIDLLKAEDDEHRPIDRTWQQLGIFRIGMTIPAMHWKAIHDRNGNKDC